MKLVLSLFALHAFSCGQSLAAEKPNILIDELISPAFPGSSVKNEDWGPGGANQKSAATNPKQNL